MACDRAVDEATTRLDLAVSVTPRGWLTTRCHSTRRCPIALLMLRSGIRFILISCAVSAGFPYLFFAWKTVESAEGPRLGFWNGSEIFGGRSVDVSVPHREALVWFDNGLRRGTIQRCPHAVASVITQILTFDDKQNNVSWIIVVFSCQADLNLIESWIYMITENLTNNLCVKQGKHVALF